MIRFAIKVGIASGAVYYLKEEGVWRESSESLKVYDKLNNALGPYIGEVKKQLPIDLSSLPEDYRLSYLTKESWNHGVLATFEFLKDLPSISRKWAQTAWKQLDIDKFLAGPPALPEASSKK